MVTAQTSKKINKSRRKQQRPRQILQAALKVFAEYGYAATRIDEVAERAGISKGTIYLYFESKEDLFIETVRHCILPSFEIIETIAEQIDKSAEQILQEQLQTIYRELVSKDARYIQRLIIGEGSRFPELAEFYYREIISRCHGTLRAVIQRGVERGEFRKSALKWHPQAIFSPALTAAIWLLLFDKYSRLDLEAYFQTHIDLLMHGLKT